MENITKVVKEEMCVGCSNCATVCKFNAIKMVTSPEGFLIPEINSQLCTNCGICTQYCPPLNTEKIQRMNPLSSFAGWSKDEKIRVSSSSGGIFYEIALSFLENGDVVYGVAWDDNLLPKHIRITNEAEIWKAMGSKYVQSNMNGVQELVEKDLLSGKCVLFTGTPCQIAAIRLYFLNREIEKNLYTVEVICHGVASRNVFSEYISVLKQQYGDIQDIRMRDKRTGWTKYSVTLLGKNGTVYTQYHYNDPFFKLYLKSAILNIPCYKCQFSSFPRFADMTIGDFWGVNSILRNEKGISCVIVNSDKGVSIIEGIKRVVLIPVSLDNIIAGNPRLISGEYPELKLRQELISKRIFDFQSILKYVRKDELMHLPKNLLKKLLRNSLRILKNILV